MLPRSSAPPDAARPSLWSDEAADGRVVDRTRCVLEPIYYPRYLCYTSPAMAASAGRLHRRRHRKPANGSPRCWPSFALAATPNYLLVQRGPYAKEGMDYSQVADVITEHAVPG